MKWKQSLKKTLKSVLVFAMVVALCGTTLAKAYATYFPVVIEHVFLDDAEPGQENENESNDENQELPDELKDLTVVFDVENKGVSDKHFFDGYYDQWLGNQEGVTLEQVGETGGDYSKPIYDIERELDVTVSNSDADVGTKEGAQAVQAALEQIMADEQGALLLEQLQQAMSSGSQADKYSAERALLALCSEKGLDVPTEEQLKNQKNQYGVSSNGENIESAKGDVIAGEYTLNFTTSFNVAFRKACEEMVQGVDQPTTLELDPMETNIEEAATQAMKESLTENSSLSDEQATAAAETAAELLQVSDIWSKSVQGAGTPFGFSSGHTIMGGAELDDKSKDVLQANGYKSTGLEIQVVIAITTPVKGEDGAEVTDEKGNVVYESKSKVYVSTDGESWKDADDPNGATLTSDDVFGEGKEVELCTYTFTHSHKETAPGRPKPGTENPDPDPGKPDPDPDKPDPDPDKHVPDPDKPDPDPDKPDPDPDKPDPDPGKPDPDPVVPDPDPVIPDPDPVTPPDEVEIADPETPLATLDEEEPVVEEEAVEEEPILEEILEPDVPLSDIPETGDVSVLWYGLAVALVAGLMVLLQQERRSKKTA